MRKKFLTAVLTALLCTSFITNIAGAATSGVIYPKTWILGNVTRIPRHELPQTLDFSDFLPLFT